MKRRGFFSTLFAPLALFAKPTSPANSDAFEYKGYKVRWSGWQSSVEHDHLHARWTAIKREGVHEFGISSTSGGVVEAFVRFQTLNLIQMHDWPYINPDSSEKEKHDVKIRALEALRKAMDEDLRPLWFPPKRPGLVKLKDLNVETWPDMPPGTLVFWENTDRVKGVITGIGDK